MLLNFGQPADGIIQIAYIVKDIETSMRNFTARLGVGPWFVSGPFVPPQGLYRGKPTKMRLTLAVGFCGHMSFELIEQHDDLPSVYLEVIKSRGYGFHHWGKPADDLDAEVAHYNKLGYETAFSDRSPRGYRVVYVDTSRDLSGMIELMERTPALEARYTEMYLASVGWDGKEPMRPAK
jgi:Glyoxalase/Bleomycin resistance protein/Dioxygenase superfamily